MNLDASDNNSLKVPCDAPFDSSNSVEQLGEESLERLGFKFEFIGRNDFELIGTFTDENGIEVNWYQDNTFGVPYGIEGNVMELKSLRDLVLLRMLLTGEAYSDSSLSALKEVVSKMPNKEQGDERSVATEV